MYSHHVLIMSRGFAINSTHRPSVIPKLDACFTLIDHGFDTDHEPFFKLRSCTTFTIVRYFRFLMQLEPYTVPYQLSHDPIAIFRNVFLYRVSNITDAFTRNSLVDTQLKRFQCHAEQLLDIICYFTHSKSIR